MGKEWAGLFFPRGKNGPAHSFPGEKTDWGEIPARYTGSLDVDKFQGALLMYRNSVDPETKASPALILFGRPIRDAIPILMGRYRSHETWTELMSHRELALAR